MYIVLYSFKVKPDKEALFLKAWSTLTEFIYQYEGSLGSRLHKKEPLLYIAYAQWPSESKFKNAGSSLPEEAKKYRDEMKASCDTIQVLDTLEVVDDLLKQKLYD